MKYLVVLGDGMSDLPIPELDNKTPLEIANKPIIDSICSIGEIGMVKTVPDNMAPGSDVANLSILGYNPQQCYTGRSPLEAVSIGVDMKDTDTAFRCNLVTLDYSASTYADATMLDYSAGEITTEEAAELIKAVDEKLGNDIFHFVPGFSYRHCLIYDKYPKTPTLTPPHDISRRPIASYLPTDDMLLDLQMKSREILENHPVNLDRIKRGLKPANSIWLWGQGTKPQLAKFKELYGLDGAIISAVDLLKGIGICAGLDIYEVPGATGYIDTNFIGKAQKTVSAFKDGKEYVYLHIEAPDECGHKGELSNKIKSIEIIDQTVLTKILEYIAETETVKILVSPDHPTPISLMTHISEPVPFCMATITPDIAKDILAGKIKLTNSYCEVNARAADNLYENGEALMKHFLE